MKNAVSPKAARLLRKVAAHILEEPRRYDQDDIISTGDPGEETCFGRIIPKCGTVACIGGWVAILSNPTSNPNFLGLSHGQKALGITEDQAGRLFSPTDEAENGWPEKFRTAFQSAKTPRGKASIAARRIEHFIKTGE